MTEQIEDYKLQVSFGYGIFKPQYMLVGISGGRLGCIETGVPFTKDMSGRLLQRALRRLGFAHTDEHSIKPVLDRIYLTNLVKGKILDSTGLNRAPNNMEIRYWMQDFRDEVEKVQPKIVVAMGSVVYDYLKDEEFIDNLYKLKHPAWYGRMGALNEDSQAWEDMLEEYKSVLGELVGGRIILR